jgi:hypothetical protein
VLQKWWTGRASDFVCKIAAVDTACALVLGTSINKLQKATLCLVVSLYLPVHMEQVGSRWMDFREILY